MGRERKEFQVLCIGHIFNEITKENVPYLGKEMLKVQEAYETPNRRTIKETFNVI